MKEESKVENVEAVVEKPVLGKRTPVYAQKAGGIKEKPGFVRRRIVEHPGRVEMLQNAGWGFVPKDQDQRDQRVQHESTLGSHARSVVNRKGNATVTHAVWMEIPEQFYNEDQLYKSRQNDIRQAAWNPKNMQKANPDLYYAGNLEIK